MVNKSMTIQYYIKSVYGTDKKYVADWRIMKLISALTHQATISSSHILALEQLGHKFEQVLPPVPCAKCGGKRDVEAIICSKCKP